MAGNIGFMDLISSAKVEEWKEQLKNVHKVVVYDECTTEPKSLSDNNFLVIVALCKLGKISLPLRGEFMVLHPRPCEVSVSPLQRSISVGPRATTPGQRDQAVGENEDSSTCLHSLLPRNRQRERCSLQGGTTAVWGEVYTQRRC